MTVMVATTFFSALGRLTANEQARAVKFVNDFQANPKSPGISLERLNQKNKDLWSGRITRDLRAIIHQSGETWALLYADHHDAAYKWAERRMVDVHPVTGVLQVIEVLEGESTAPPATETPSARSAPPVPGLFDAHDDSYLVSLGLPPDWVPAIRHVRDDEGLLQIVDKLPEDVAERLIDLAEGKLVTPPLPVNQTQPAQHPDVRRRFFVVDDAEELQRALEAPLEKWLVFLHPSQSALAQGTFRGPVKVTGSAGTGKTVVAIHRARHLARMGKRVLLTTYVSTLAKNIQTALALLCRPDEYERITVSTVHKQALAIVKRSTPNAAYVADSNQVGAWLNNQRLVHAPSFSREFVDAEWHNVVQVQGIGSWDEYRRARRIGRGKPLSVAERKTLWAVFREVQTGMRGEGRVDWAGACLWAAELLADDAAMGAPAPFDAVIVDEVQDLRVPELRFIAALSRRSPESLMLAGDTGQRIYPGGFSLAALGIDVRGRSHILRINYRTTEQIRRLAEAVVGNVADDMEGGRESRSVRSLLRGPQPSLIPCDGLEAEVQHVGDQIESWVTKDGLPPRAIAIFARTRRRLDKLGERLRSAGIPVRDLADEDTDTLDAVALGTMHRAKGLEFKAVAIVGASDDQLPSSTVLRQCTDPQDREDAEERERRLLYVAMTRARDELLITWTGLRSRFLNDLPTKKTEETR